MATKKAPPAPTTRKFTVNDVRALAFERGTFWIVPTVAVVAAVVSFDALYWFGRGMGLTWWVVPLIPLVIDGFAIICSFGIIRSQAGGEPLRKRMSEWVGLVYALALSIGGNVAHVLQVSPPWLQVAIAMGPPVIVAYSIHILGRSNSKGLSSRVYADDPTAIQLDIPGVDDGAHVQPAPAARPAVERARPVERQVLAQPERAPQQPARTAPQPERAPDPVSAPADAQPARTEETVERAPAAATTMREVVETARGDADLQLLVREQFDAALELDPGTKPDASRLHDAAGIGDAKSKATTRRWVSTWWSERQAAEDVDRDAAAHDEVRQDQQERVTA